MEDLIPRPETGRLLDAWWGASQAMKRHVAPLLEREHGLDFKDFLLLDAIFSGARFPGQIVERLAIPPSNVSRILDDLTHRNLVQRTLDEQDSRRVRLTLTGAGDEALKGARATMTLLMEAALHSMPDADLNAFTRGLQQLHATLIHASEICPHLRAVSDVPKEATS